MKKPSSILRAHALSLTALCLMGTTAVTAQGDDDVPVTIKELDVQGAIREFHEFQRRLGKYREGIGQGQSVAKETAQILAELRSSATAENGFNEEMILEAVAAYVDGVVQKQVDLVDFLESQRYRINYYANKMASSVRADDLAMLFGTVEQNEVAIGTRVRSIEVSRLALAAFMDTLPADAFDKVNFRALPGMKREDRRKLDGLTSRFQQERNSLDLAKKRMELVRSSQRAMNSQRGATPKLEADLLVGQMFGTLDRVRLQMSMDLLYLEHLLTNFAQSARTQEILQAFQDLMELQGDLEGPSPALAGVFDWLQDSSTRRLSMSAVSFTRPDMKTQRSSDLLREAYQGARGEIPSKP